MGGRVFPYHHTVERFSGIWYGLHYSSEAFQSFFDMEEHTSNHGCFSDHRAIIITLGGSLRLPLAHSEPIQHSSLDASLGDWDISHRGGLLTFFLS